MRKGRMRIRNRPKSPVGKLGSGLGRGNPARQLARGLARFAMEAPSQGYEDCVVCLRRRTPPVKGPRRLEIPAG